VHHPLLILSYDPESVRQIEDAYNGQRAQVPLSHGFFATSGGYTVDLTRMTQTRDSTGFQRPIRRIPPVPPLPGRTARAVPSRKVRRDCERPLTHTAPPNSRTKTRCHKVSSLGKKGYNLRSGTFPTKRQ
jgi:hypothetical protein